mmetsp:Transcript_25945/g.65402  ORF Transcript_25945/g.65402 Transcript_25945/m.65402 type:complete len:431 (+) Transcript_25945:414-1706(+)
MAHASDAPLATLSAALSVCVTLHPKNSLSLSRTTGMRLLPPTTSTPARSSRVTPAISRARAHVPDILSNMPCLSHAASSCSLVYIPDTSVSCIMHSTLMGVSRSGGLADSVFLRRSHCIRRRSEAFCSVRASTLYFALNSSAKCWNSTSSTSLPPNARSLACESTLSLPLLKATTDTCMQLCPTSTKHTMRGFSSGRSVLVMPYSSAVATFSLIRLRHFSPASSAASLTMLRCSSVQSTGTPMTQSVTSALWSAAAIFFRLLSSIETTCACVKTRSLPVRDALTHARPSLSPWSWYSTCFVTSFSNVLSLTLPPTSALIPVTVFLRLDILCVLPASPRNRWVCPNETTEGVERDEASLTTMSTPLRRAMATTQLSLPKSIPSTAPVGAARVRRGARTASAATRARRAAPCLPPNIIFLHLSFTDRLVVYR